MYETVLKIRRNLEGDMIIAADDHQGWKVSEELRIQILTDIRDQLGGEHDALASRLFKRIVCI